ncbi:hypothetical protein FM125_06400 [Micrococcus lylae]|uniref:Helix-turn-helix domain-containing protein n=1 Tax=Micrococcus lylae TaxID=1273 RepID=A0A1R4J4Y6_9MICC|nr:hypothetical protein [Micrococcus lylae]SJN26835.1 hypothetical protein FM125_06400 [Micrococcus lylae]
MTEEKDYDAILRRMQGCVEHAEKSASEFRDARNEVIREAVESGMSMYRIAKITGLSQQMVARIRGAS